MTTNAVEIDTDSTGHGDLSAAQAESSSFQFLSNSPQHETTIDFHNFYFYEPFVVSLLTEYIPVVRDDGQEVIESAAVRKVHDANSNDIISVVLDAVPEERQTERETDRQTDRQTERKRE